MPSLYEANQIDYITIQEGIDKLCAQLAGNSAPNYVIFNTWAYAMDWRGARKSSGTDSVCNVYLTEPNLQEEKMELILFSPDQTRLPNVREQNDILCLQNVKLSIFKGKYQLMGKFNAKQSAAFKPFNLILFSQHAPPRGMPEQPYHKILAGVPMWDQHGKGGKMLDHMRQLITQPKPIAGGPIIDDGLPSKLLKIEDLALLTVHNPKERVDLIAQVLAIDRRDPSCSILHVWDGTDAPILPKSLSTKPYVMADLSPTFTRQPLPLTGMGPPSEHEEHLVECNLEPHACGTSVPLLKPVTSLKLGTAVGSWIKIHDVSPFLIRGQLQLVYSSSRSRYGLRDFPPGREEKSLGEYEERKRDRGLWGVHAPPPEALASCCLQSDKEVSTVRQILVASSVGGTGVFRIIARVTDYFPSYQNLSAALVPWADLPPLGELQSNPAYQQPGYTFLLSLLLEDASGQLDARLVGEDAEAFFSFAPRSAEQQLPHLARCLEELARVPDIRLQQPRDRAPVGPTPTAVAVVPGSCWLDCCVRVVHLHGASPSPVYRLVETRLLQGRSPLL